MKIKIIIIVVSLLILAFFVSPFIAILASNDISDYMLKQFAYHRIANYVTAGSNNDEQIANKLNEWVYLNLEQGNGLGYDDVIDYSPYFDLVRGIGWCDQKSTLLCKLLYEKGVKARSILFSWHTISEVIIDSKPVQYDSSFNCIAAIQDDSAKYADYNDSSILRNITGSILSLYPKVYVDLWVDAYLKVRNGNYVNFNQIGTIQQSYIDKYSMPEFSDIFKARTYHIFMRYDKALPIYESLLNSSFRDETLFYLVQLGILSQNYDLIYEYFNPDLFSSSDSRYYHFSESYLCRYCDVIGE